MSFKLVSGLSCSAAPPRLSILSRPQKLRHARCFSMMQFMRHILMSSTIGESLRRRPASQANPFNDRRHGLEKVGTVVAS